MTELEHRVYTERLRLRIPAPQDAEALYALFANAEVMQGLGRDCVSAVEDVRAIIEGMLDGWRTDGVGAFVLETAAPDPQVVGQAGVMIFDARDWTPYADAIHDVSQPRQGAAMSDRYGRG